MPVRQKDALRALELLQQYRAKLAQRQQNQDLTKQGPVEEDHQLEQSLDRVINVFQSQLFSALLDIQEYYELMILSDSQSSVDQVAGPGNLSASSVPLPGPSAQSQPAAGSLTPQASGGPAPPKPLTPKPKSVKSPAPPIPSGAPTTKPSSPTTQSSTPQPAKVKYRAPLPPVLQPEVPTAGETSKPTSPSSTTPGAVTENVLEPSTGSSATRTQISLNGKKAPLTATDFPESCTTITSPQAGRDLVTVSALVSGTIQGIVSQTTPDQLPPTSTTPTTSPGPNRVTDPPITPTTLKTSRDPGVGKGTPTSSPTSPSQGTFTFGSLSPTSPPGPLNRRPLLSPTSPGSLKVSSPSPSQGPASPRTATAPQTPIKHSRKIIER
ncbi:uncharacterized protein ACBR49_008139 [Aulostomus maculatus]